jgi:hypothetical protein
MQGFRARVMLWLLAVDHGWLSHQPQARGQGRGLGRHGFVRQLGASGFILGLFLFKLLLILLSVLFLFLHAFRQILLLLASHGGWQALQEEVGARLLAGALRQP